jgi:hypothetical protein
MPIIELDCVECGAIIPRTEVFYCGFCLRRVCQTCYEAHHAAHDKVWETLPPQPAQVEGFYTPTLPEPKYT